MRAEVSERTSIVSVSLSENTPRTKSERKKEEKEYGKNQKKKKKKLTFNALFFFFFKTSETVTDTTPIPPPDWEALIGQVAKEIMEERTPARILQVRAKLYDLLTHCIPATTILKTLTLKLVEQIDDDLKPEVVRWSALYEHRVKTGTKAIFHLESFVAKFMRIYEMYLMSMEM